jgi:hypothetical protein
VHTPAQVSIVAEREIRSLDDMVLVEENKDNSPSTDDEESAVV